MKISADDSADLARILMNEFAERTGLTGAEGVEQDRYLWTDAFAVQNFLALSSYFDNDEYTELARECIEQVHYTLGRYAPGDDREGWISELSEKEGQKHPTKNGLRIGKKELERKKAEPLDSRTEWDRDGQYFHYHTRWINALLTAAEHLGNDKYIAQAAELSLAGKNFLHETTGQKRLYWKMSVDLSYPQITTMGAHDPLDGYLTALSCKMMASDTFEFTDYLEDLKDICRGKSWQTDDPLGLGGLLLNAIRAAELDRDTDLPGSIRPRKLFSDAKKGLEAFEGRVSPGASAKHRLAFRECGLTLGLRTADGDRDQLIDKFPEIESIDDSLELAKQIEDFWSEGKNREYSSYLDHRNINDVSLSSSFLARIKPEFYK